jgi:hypothetical protein
MKRLTINEPFRFSKNYSVKIYGQDISLKSTTTLVPPTRIDPADEVLT